MANTPAMMVHTNATVSGTLGSLRIAVVLCDQNDNGVCRRSLVTACADTSLLWTDRKCSQSAI